MGARNYIEHTTERGGYWGYWRKPACWDSEQPWSNYQTTISIDDVARFAFECDDDLLIMGALPSYEVVRHWGKDYERQLQLALEASPMTEPLCRSERVGAAVGLLKGHFFFRESVGAGWALVGDAGLHMDPTPGHGITDALRDAAALARALVDGRPQAQQVYWRRRDAESVGLYYQGIDMGRMGFANPFSELMMDGLRRAGAPQQARIHRVIDRELRPQEMVEPMTALGWLARGVLERRRGLLPAFMASARFMREVSTELELRKRLLAEAEAALA